MQRVSFSTVCLYGGTIDPTEYTDRDTGEVRLSAPKVQLLEQDDTGRLRPMEIKTEQFIQLAGIDPDQLDMGDRVRLEGVYVVRDGFPIFDRVTVESGAAA